MIMPFWNLMVRAFKNFAKPTHKSNCYTFIADTKFLPANQTSTEPCPVKPQEIANQDSPMLQLTPKLQTKKWKEKRKKTKANTLNFEKAYWKNQHHWRYICQI